MIPYTVYLTALDGELDGGVASIVATAEPIAATLFWRPAGEAADCWNCSCYNWRYHSDFIRTFGTGWNRGQLRRKKFWWEHAEAKEEQI